MGALVSPVPRLGRSVRALGVSLVFVLMFLASAAAQDADFGVPADAPQPDEGRITRVLTIGVVEEGTCADGQAAPCWDVTTLAANPGDTVVLHADLRNSQNFHNLHATTAEDASTTSDGPKTDTAGSALHSVAIKMPAEGQITFICDVHPQTMVGTIVTPAAAAAAGGAHESVPAMGVHFLAYWVGVIAFAILFIVYGLTFFLFKYNETNATTDHWDRGEAGASRGAGAYASLLAVGIAVVAIAAVMFLATRR